MWRLDFQVGDEADREAEVKPENAARRVRAACSARTSISRSSGSASTASSRAACSASATAACCSPATPRTRCRRSARAAATAACRTPTTSCGSSISCCGGWPRSACSTATTPSASPPPTRTCSTPPAPRISSPPRARPAAIFRDSVLALAETEPFARRLVNSGPALGRHLLRRLAPQRRRRLRRGRVPAGAPGRRRARCAAGRWLAARTPSAPASPASGSLRRQRPGGDREHPGGPDPARAAGRAAGRLRCRRPAPVTAPPASPPSTSSAPTAMSPPAGASRR